jgi:hypothetical protein
MDKNILLSLSFLFFHENTLWVKTCSCSNKNIPMDEKYKYKNKKKLHAGVGG